MSLGDQKYVQILSKRMQFAHTIFNFNFGLDQQLNSPNQQTFVYNRSLVHHYQTLPFYTALFYATTVYVKIDACAHCCVISYVGNHIDLLKQDSYIISPLLIAGALADNGRLPMMSSMIGAFGRIMSAHRGEVVCVVTTAKVCRQSYFYHHGK